MLRGGRLPAPGGVLGLMGALLLVTWPGSTLATDVFYPDLEVRSPDKHWRLSATSPDNTEKGRAAAFAKNFTFALYDDQTGAVIWTRRQQPDESSPTRALVNDDGQVVISTGRPELVLLDRTDGSRKLSIRILDQFPEVERRQYVHESTAGPQWAKRSIWRFIAVNGRSLFVLRTWWDRRIVLDVSAGALLKDEGKLHSDLDVADREWVLRTLEAAQAAGPPKSMECCDLPAGVWDVMAAAQLAGRAKIHDSAGALRELETWPSVGSSGGPPLSENLKAGDIDPRTRESRTIRQIAQTALRRIGEKPAGVAATGFRYVGTNGDPGKPVEIRSPLPDRADGVVRLHAGMTPAEVLGVVGAPDFAGRRSMKEGELADVWEYDLDTCPPCTLRVTWSARDLHVESIERIAPPLWQDNTRDEDN